MKRISLILLLIGLGITSIYAQGTTLNGSGTAADPYLVENLQDLITISQVDSLWCAHFLQTADIDASSTSELNDGAGFNSIGNNTIKFTGSYDGQGYAISNLYINRPSTNFIGLFGYIYGANISNVGLIDAEVTGYSSVGGLVGLNYSSTISNSYATGAVSGSGSVGGLVGQSTSSTISNSYATGAVSGGNWYIGGLVGNSSSSTISNSYAIGAVSGSSSYVGGLVGKSNSSSISNSYSTGAVSGDDEVGGLVGYRYSGSVNNSFWDISTSGQSSSAGGTGKTTLQMQDINTYVNSGWDIGNIWGISSSLNSGYPIFMNNIITNNSISNNASNISLTPTINFQANFRYSYFELYFGSTPNPESAIIPFSPITNPISYTFTDSLEYFTDYYWTLNLYDTNYEITTLNFTFKTRPEMEGLGTEESPYLVSTITDLIRISSDSYFWDKHYLQTADIDASSTTELNEGAGFSPIGYDYDHSFTGSYDGQGHTISNLYINRPSTDDIGLFGCTSGANISNVGLIDAEVTGEGYVGGLVGYSHSSSISNSYSTGAVSGSGSVGGLVGSSSSTISKSYSTGAVSGGERLGGLVGNSSYSTISNSYARGAVTGSGNYVGGLVGYNYSSSISNSFWDINTSGQTASAGGTGKTSQEMKSLYTYLNAGWDFVGEETNGSDDIWYIHPAHNSGYPSIMREGQNEFEYLPNYALVSYPNDGDINLATSDNLIWEQDYLELTSGYRINLGTDNPPTNVINNQDLGLTTSYEYSNLEANTRYYWQVIAYNETGDAEDSPIWTFTTCSTSLVCVGRGLDTTAPLPINHATKRSYSQSIYLQSELNLSNRQIEKLSFYLKSDNLLTGSNQWKVYLGHTDKTEFASANDWLLPSAGLTQVADVTLNDTTSVGWMEIELTTPFAYNNSDNLIVSVIEYSAETSNLIDFYTVDTESNRSLSFGHDSTTPNPNIPYSGVLSTSIPKINFTFSEATTRFTGLVQSSDNVPLDNATVYIEEFGNLPTNSLGQFNIHNVEAGTYQLTVSAPWYETQTVEFQVIEGEDNYLDITLLEELLPANNVIATLAEDLSNVNITWSAPAISRVTNLSKQAKGQAFKAKENLIQKQELEERTGQPDVLYNLYRYGSGDEETPENWVQVTTNLDALTYVDTSFPSLELGTYYWAVETVYANDRLADPTISNEILKQPYLESNIDEQIDFGIVYLTNESEYSEIILTNSGTGDLTLSAVSCEESAFNLLYDQAEFLVQANASVTLQVNFIPDSPGVYMEDLIITNNSTNEPNYTISLRGVCEYLPPANPEGVQVVMVNNTSNISWDAVTEDINNNAITPDLYIVYYNGQNTDTDNDFYFLASTPELSYNHVNVGLFSEFMFYRVKAYVDVNNVLLSQIEDLVAQKRKVSMKEVEGLIEKAKIKTFTRINTN